MKKANIIVITNRKGGSGKTTTAKNLAYNLKKDVDRVLLIDMDPQCNATDGLSSREFKKSVLGLLRGADIHHSIFHTRFSRLDIIPGSDYLASENIQDNILDEQLDSVRSEYDYIVIDTSPYFNKLTVEILKAGDLVLIPTPLDEDSLKGASTTIQELTALFNGKLRCCVLPTMVDDTKYAAKLLQQLQQALGSLCFKTHIRTNVTPVRRARERRIPLSRRYPHAKVTKDYEHLTEELKEMF